MRNVYMSHPVSAPTREGVLQNLENAKDWVVRLVKDLGVAVTADWITLASRWDETVREFALSIDRAQVERCDAVVMVGGRISEGMQIEANHARLFGIPVHDWTYLGYAPPSVLDTSLVAELARSGIVQGTTHAWITGRVVASRRTTEARRMLAYAGGSYGRLCKAILQKKPRAEIQTEALHLAAAAVRLCEEGDPSFDGLTDAEAFGVPSSPSRLPDPKTIKALANEIARARAKFPGSRFMLAALGEEFGEACDALVDGSLPELARREALQVACCAIRLYEEGDPSMPAAENPDG
jgi:hypothetical protein